MIDSVQLPSLHLDIIQGLHTEQTGANMSPAACDIRCMQLSLKIEQHSSGLFVVHMSLLLRAKVWI